MEAIDEEVLVERARRAGTASARAGTKRTRAVFGGNLEYGCASFMPAVGAFMLSAVADEYAHEALPEPPAGAKSAKSAIQRAEVESSLGIKRASLFGRGRSSASEPSEKSRPTAQLLLTDTDAFARPGIGKQDKGTAASASAISTLSGELSSKQAVALRSAAVALERATSECRADASPSTAASLVADALRSGGASAGIDMLSAAGDVSSRITGAAGGQSAPTSASAAAEEATAAALRRADAIADAARGASRAMAGRASSRAVPVPEWHAPWKLMRVVTGHTGWVRCAAVDPSNQWYAVGAQDRTVRVYDLASSKLKLTLTGHVSAVRSIVLSERHPYMFTCGEDKQVFCWDLETNTVVRKYFGHTAGVFSLALHPRLDVLFSAGRDSTCRVWDMRTKHQVHCLSGHKDAVVSIGTQAVEPQVITGSMDRTVRLWDLAAGKCQGVLTHHKRAVRSIACSTKERSFVSAAADGIRKWAGADVHLERTLEGHEGIVHSAVTNEDGVLASAGDDGELRFWDYRTGYCFQSAKAPPQAGSLDSESAVFALAFDRSGSRLVTCGADKTIKVWGEDSEASEETHPIDMAAWKRELRKHRRV